jgi:hypothetical protein
MPISIPLLVGDILDLGQLHLEFLTRRPLHRRRLAGAHCRRPRLRQEPRPDSERFQASFGKYAHMHSTHKHSVTHCHTLAWARRRPPRLRHARRLSAKREKIDGVTVYLYSPSRASENLLFLSKLAKAFICVQCVCVFCE